MLGPNIIPWSSAGNGSSSEYKARSLYPLSIPFEAIVYPSGLVLSISRYLSSCSVLNPSGFRKYCHIVSIDLKVNLYPYFNNSSYIRFTCWSNLVLIP